MRVFGVVLLMMLDHLEKEITLHECWTSLGTYHMEKEAHGQWDDSILTKEERDANIRRKVEAIIKRERALAYAHSHQLLTVTPKTAHSALTDTRSGGFPWWNWLERQINSDPNHPKTPAPPTPTTSTTTPTANAKFPLPETHSKPAKTSFIPSTPRSLQKIDSHRSSNRWQEMQATPTLRDTDSLTSCPAFTASRLTNTNSATAARNYMTTTVSAKAKIRPVAADCGRVGKEGRRRFSFSLSQTIGSLSLFSANQKADPPHAPSTATGGMHRSMRSVGELSVDSTISLPAGFRRTHLR
ncbi:hypothetical protein HPP92_011681 [Vanilla planifolia]|uniref:DUF4005 domain-containing protein n=1 Tax=Vanilla planifolia TaxID=51239 RepID=A0A835QZJ4_VANPL|nr:hypothetical protein HPP92_011681 [Vanilla planifolia]